MLNLEQPQALDTCAIAKKTSHARSSNGNDVDHQIVSLIIGNLFCPTQFNYIMAERPLSLQHHLNLRIWHSEYLGRLQDERSKPRGEDLQRYNHPRQTSQQYAVVCIYIHGLKVSRSFEDMDATSDTLYSCEAHDFVTNDRNGSGEESSLIFE